MAVQAEAVQISCFGVGTAEAATASAGTQTDAARGNGALPRALLARRAGSSGGAEKNG